MLRNIKNISHYHKNGNVAQEATVFLFNKNFLLFHRTDGKPAITGYFHTGGIKSESWFENGQLHNEHGPAEIIYEKP